MLFLKKVEFSEFANLGDLRLYTLDEISALIKDLKRQETVEGQINFVTWSNEYYVFIIEYDLHGKFRRINKQYWIDNKQSLLSIFRKSIK